MRLYVAGIGVWSPRLPSWPACRTRLAAGAVQAGENTLPKAEWLPPVERRRATLSTRVVLTVTQEALTAANWSPAQLPTVFASSSGSPDITDELCAALAAGDTQISPTRFHNSVHNAAAGYYSIAVGCRAPSTSLAAYDASAVAGLIEAAALAAADATPVLFCSFDVPYTGPLALVRPVVDPWGVALALAPEPAPGQIARLDLAWSGHVSSADSVCADADLEYMRLHNPSARLLPLLALLAGPSAGSALFSAAPAGQLRIDVSPC